MSYDSESPGAKQQPEAKISFFDRTPAEADKIRLEALKQLRSRFSNKAEMIGLQGTGFQNCLEDWVNEAYIIAEEQLERWDPKLGGSVKWVYLKGKDIAQRWFDRYHRERRKTRELIFKGSALVHDVNASKDPCDARADRALVDEILRNDLSLSNARILKLRQEGFKMVEIAEREGLSKDTVQRRYNRAQEKAREARALRENGPPPGKAPGLTPKPPSSSDLPLPKARNQQRRLKP